MSDDELIALTPAELRVLARLVRALIRVGGSFSREEAERLDEMAREIAAAPREDTLAGGPYRDAAGREPLGLAALHALLEQAAAEPSSDEALLAAARSVERREAREHIHGLLGALAMSGTALPAELAMLERLAREWRL